MFRKLITENQNFQLFNHLVYLSLPAHLFNTLTQVLFPCIKKYEKVTDIDSPYLDSDGVESWGYTSITRL
jgi:hypothetical protein